MKQKISTFIKTCLLMSLTFWMLMFGHAAHAHGRVSWHLGIGVGSGYGYPHPGYWGPRYYYDPYPYYYYPPQPVQVVVPVQAEPVYVQRPPTPAPQNNYWYFCRESNTYYPYVQQCAGPWQPVPAQPAPAPSVP